MSDVGLRLLDSLYEQMMIDAEWAVRRERGFTWWAYRLAQHVEVGPPVWSEDRYICSVRIWTEVVRDVDPETDPAAVLGEVNRLAHLSALVWDPEEATIAECCTAVVHDEIFGWLSKVLATAAVLQNTAAHSRAHALARATGGVPAASNHPSTGERPAMDDVLNVPEQLVASEGTKPSQFVGQHFARVEDFLRQHRFVGSVEADGLTCEVPFAGQLPSAAVSEDAQLQTSLVQMFTDAPHPEAGNGLLCLLQLPLNADPKSIRELANRLNLMESRGDTGTLLLGAWCPDPSAATTLAFCSFVPNLIAKWILVENLVSYLSSHSRFAGAALGDHAPGSLLPENSPQPPTKDGLSVSEVPAGSEMRDEVLDLAKRTAHASSRIAASAARVGMAKLRRRFGSDAEAGAGEESTLDHSLLQNYLDDYLQPDDEWLERDGNRATYWQARLAQMTTVSVLGDGRAKWQVRTHIVEKVGRPDEALQLCLALNRYAAGWTFAYDAESRTVDALIAVCAPPAWDTLLLRLAEKATLSAWMSDVIAERLAEAVDGAPAFGHPKRQPGLRREFDRNYYYAQAVRRRPEWVMDPTLYDYLPMEDVADYIAKMVDASHGVESSPEGFRMPVQRTDEGDSVFLMGGFGTHPVLGDGFHSALVLGGAPTSSALEQLATMTWGLFNDPQASMLGGWYHHNGHFAFIQWNTCSEIRKQERLQSWDGRGIGDLWGFTSTLIDPLNALARVGLSRGDESAFDPSLDDTTARVVAAISEQAQPAVERALSQPSIADTSSDASLLWLERDRTLAVAVWFDPLKPMVTSLEVGRLPDGTECLVCFRRQPFMPEYRIVGPVAPGDGLTADAVNALLPATLPNALALWTKPEATADEVPAILRNRILEVASGSGRDLLAEAEWVSTTMGHPWEMVTRGSVVADMVRTAARAGAEGASIDPFTRWWSEVSRYENVMANFTFMPDAWDGAITSQRAYKPMDDADVGPLVLTFAADRLKEGSQQ